MDFERIERLMRLLESSALQNMEVIENGVTIRLSKASGPAPMPAQGVSVQPAPLTPSEPQNSVPGAVTLRSGMAGLFYRAPAPGEPPFVEIGRMLSEGDVIGLIEAMKTFNPVESEHGGRVIEIHVTDGQSVSPGDALITLAQAD